MAWRNLYEGCFSPSQPVAFLERHSIQTAIQSSLSQLDPIALTSYDLLPTEGQRETIVVPGSPAVWSPQSLPVRLKRDALQPAICEAFPSCPMEPLFRAISITAPETDFNSFDIITDRRNLRLLMNFASHQEQEEFRFDVEIVGNSVIFSRWIDWESRRFNAGYGKEFERKFTKIPECSRGSLVHKRAVGYTLGGLRLMVRFEVDACLEAPAEDSGKGEVVMTLNGHKLILKGALSKAEEVVEIKTRAARGAVNCGITEKDMSQMWLSMTPILCQGFHKNGVFERIEVTDYEQKLGDWEKRSQERIGGLVQVLRCLKGVMKEVAGNLNRFALVCENGSDCLKVYRLEETYPFRLPQDLRKKWRSEEEEGQLGGSI
ncbi:hypothetical protein BYT27DRAFT_7134500 [Phlegmacium glaucopus]|nr:hypothetical protein BYT27DRAFT_7134500 [Phlegmacium glaucopus]